MVAKGSGVKMAQAPWQWWIMVVKRPWGLEGAAQGTLVVLGLSEGQTCSQTCQGSPHCCRDAWDHPRRRSSGEQGLCSSRSRPKVWPRRVCMAPVSPSCCWEQAAASKWEPCSPRSSSARAGVQEPKPSHLQRGEQAGQPRNPNTPHTMSSAGGLAGAQHIPIGGNKPLSALLLSGAVGAGDQGAEPVSGQKLSAGAWEQERRLRGICLLGREERKSRNIQHSG